MPPIAPTVLLLDDFPDSTEPVAIWLAAEGFSPICATTAEEAMSYLASAHLDALVMEPYLMAGSGMAVAVEARRRYADGILLVSLTANWRTANDAAYEPTLFNLNLVKPVSMSRLTLALRGQDLQPDQTKRASGTTLARSWDATDLASSASNLAGGRGPRPPT